MEESADLLTWTPVGGTPEVLSQTSAEETVRVVIPKNGNAQKFYRLRVTKAN